MTIYIKKIYNYLNNSESKYFILAAKTTSAGHHILDLDRDLKILRTWESMIRSMFLRHLVSMFA